MEPQTVAAQDFKCPKCGGRVVKFDDYLGANNGGKKISVISCQICGWRPKAVEKRIEDIFTDAAPPESLPVCVDCGREKKIYAKQRCQTCYRKMREKARAEANEKSAPPKLNEKSAPPSVRKVINIPRDQIEQPEEVYIHFYARDAELLKHLKDAAEQNRRSLANEILWRLDQPAPTG